ncbi:MAG: NAD(+)/NADH kinase [Actinomycetota bacterium]
MEIKKVAFAVHPTKPEATLMRHEIEELLAPRNIEVDEENPDLVLALGGDGTMLQAAHTAHASNAPLLGVNFGALGYLTEVEAGEELDALKRVLDGDYRIEERMMLDCRVTSDGEVAHLVGLNEVLVERSARYRLVRLDVSVSGERLATFNADGVIVATPTGSTAYALSAGGPIISPRAKALVIVPVSPHMVFSRPVVLAPDDEVTIRVDEAVPVASLSLDGRLGRKLQPGDVVTARRHDRPLRLIRLSGPDFLERLRRKLDLRS